jgi:RNA polymerase sigma factor
VKKVVFFRAFHRDKFEHSGELYSLLKNAKAKDDFAREKLIAKYTPFVLKTASKHLGRFVDKNTDDEASISLIAFNEAIDSFDFDMKVSFLTFSETVIKRRLIDYARKEKRHRETPLSSMEIHDENTVVSAEITEASKQYSLKMEAIERKQEIIRYKELLSTYGVGFDVLEKASPKHKQARERAFLAAKVLAEDHEMRSYLTKKKMLPLNLLEKKVEISRKTLERQRTYIVAVAIILMEDLPHLRNYISI